MKILYVCKREYINGSRFMAMFCYSVDSSAALFLLSSRWDSAPATLQFPPATFFQFENPALLLKWVLKKPRGTFCSCSKTIFIKVMAHIDHLLSSLPRHLEKLSHKTALNDNTIHLFNLWPENIFSSRFWAKIPQEFVSSISWRSCCHAWLPTCEY